MSSFTAAFYDGDESLPITGSADDGYDEFIVLGRVAEPAVCNGVEKYPRSTKSHFRLRWKLKKDRKSYLSTHVKYAVYSAQVVRWPHLSAQRLLSDRGF